MTASRTLRKLRKCCCARLGRLEARLTGISTVSTGTLPEILVGNVAIESLNSWANFTRTYYLSCFLSPRTECGVPLSVTSTAAAGDAMGIAIRTWRPRATPNASGVWSRRDEPTWHDPNTLLTLAAVISCSNLADIQAAFSLGYSVFRDLPVCRNFFAHRNRHTERAAMDIALRHGIAGHPRPAKLLLSFPYGRPEPLLLEWLHQISFTVQYLCH
jgi:hypothetical protein